MRPAEWGIWSAGLAIGTIGWQVSSVPHASSSQARRRIVVTTVGSLGDLYPYLAVALGLKDRGHEVIVGTSECYRGKVEGLGLGFRAVRPDSDWIGNAEMMRRMSHPRWGMARVYREWLMPALRESYTDLLAATAGADLLVSSVGMCASRLVAEKTGITWVSAVHIPLGLASAYDPPVIPGVAGLSKCLRPLGPVFWRPLRAFLKWLNIGAHR